jgi:hypothetical protein
MHNNNIKYERTNEISDRRYGPPIHSKVIKLIIHNIKYEGHTELYFYSLDDPTRNRNEMALPAKHTSKGVSSARAEVIHNIGILLSSIFSLNYPEYPIEDQTRNHRIYKLIVVDKVPPIEIIRREIGRTIYTAFDLAPLFTHLWNKAKEQSETKPHLMIMTNDMEIPWGWATNPEDTSFCLADKFSIGYITPEDIASYEERMSIWDEDIRREIANEKEFIEEKQSSRVLLALGSGLEEAKRELENLVELFKEHSFDSDNILQICPDEFSRGPFLLNLISKRKLRIVHFAGHVTPAGNLILGDGHEIEPNTIRDLNCFQVKRFDSSSPLVFLNGCSSAKLKDPYRKADQLSTAFASIGAIACVTTRFEVKDWDAAEFAHHFYKELLCKFGLTVGNALSNARSSFIAKFEKDKSLWHIPYFYCLYGNPAVEVFPRVDEGFESEAQILIDKSDKKTKNMEDMFGKPLGNIRKG